MFYKIEIDKPMSLYVKDIWFSDVLKELGQVRISGYVEEDTELEESLGEFEKIKLYVEPTNIL